MFRRLKGFYRPFPARRPPSPRPRPSRPRVEALEERQLLSTIPVHAGDDLQAVLSNVARPGDTLVLDAGATFVGPITLPNKSGGQWITLQSSALGSLPDPGQRVGPEHAALMPKIVSPGLGQAALLTEAGAHHYRLAGIEFLPQTPTAFVYNLIALGDGGSSQTSLAQVPHDLTFDQCYIHAWPQQDLFRGIALNSAETSILNSYVAGFKSVGLDSQAIAGWNGPGPFHIINNYLEGSGENVMFGGAVAAISGLVPSDIEIRRNYFFKPLSWKADDPSYAGTPWTVKNLFELKNARRVLIEGNVLENNWVESQNGFTILFTVRDENGSMPWAAVENVTFQNNIVRHVAGGFNIGGTDNVPSARTQHILIRNNLIDDIAPWGDNGILLQIINGANDVVVDHNTAFPTYAIVIADVGPSTGLVYQNNVTTYGSYGIIGNGTAPGNETVSQYFPGAVVVANVLAGQPQQAAFYPAGNFFPASLAAVGFVDLAGGDYRLAATSRYKGAGTDGNDLGADIDAILATMTLGAPRSLSVTGFPSSIAAGAAGSFTVTAKDPFGNTAAGYRGTVHFSSDDSQAVLPDDYTFTAADAGVHTFRATLKTAGTWSLTATDTVTPTLAGTQAGIVVTAAAGSLVLAGFPSSITAGAAGSFTLTVLDPFGNTAAGYRGTVHFSSDDSQAVLPGDYTFTAADSGMHTFRATLKTAGTRSLTATDTATPALTGTQAVAVNPAPATSLVLAGFPSSITAGAAGSFTLTAKDPFGNTATGYTGTVHFTSSDPQAVLPPDDSFGAADAGVQTFSATLNTAGTWSLTATDTVTPALTGTQAGIVVTAAVGRFLVSGFPAPITAGVTGTVQVTAQDALGSTVTGYRGTVHFSSDDSQAVLPGDYTFTAADNGVHTFRVTLKTAGTQSITVRDTLLPGMTGTQGSIRVNPAAASGLNVAGFPSPATAGTAGTFTVTVTDPFGNTVTGYRGTVRFRSSDGQAALPGNYTFTAADSGVHSFSATLKTAGTQTLTAKDTVTTSLTGTQAGIVVSPAAARTLLVAGFPSPAVRTIDNPFTVTAKDAFGNTAAGYRGTVHFTSSDRRAVLPGDYTFTAADSGTHAFSATFQTAGTQSLSATDTVTPGITGTQTGIVVGSPMAPQGPGGAGPGAADPPPLTRPTAEPFITEAIARWRAAGIPAERLDALSQVDVRIADLFGSYLGLASPGVTWIDPNAAGYGWFLDSTPTRDEEFTGIGDSPARGRMDLLSVVAHELGHLLGFEHSHDGAVMAETLAPGVRLMPMAEDLDQDQDSNGPASAGDLTRSPRPLNGEATPATANGEAPIADSAARHPGGHALDPESAGPASLPVQGPTALPVWEGAGTGRELMPAAGAISFNSSPADDEYSNRLALASLTASERATSSKVLHQVFADLEGSTSADPVVDDLARARLAGSSS